MTSSGSAISAKTNDGVDSNGKPAIAREARRQRAAIYWGDEMGLRSDHASGTSYAPVGHTLVTRVTTSVWARA